MTHVYEYVSAQLPVSCGGEFSSDSVSAFFFPGLSLVCAPLIAMSVSRCVSLATAYYDSDNMTTNRVHGHVTRTALREYTLK